MSLPILQTKLYAPRHQRQKNVVPRPHLTAKLTEGLTGKVTLLSAPAGFGKSTLLSEWISQNSELEIQATPSFVTPHAARRIPNSVAWLTLDSDDNDPVRLLVYLIASLQKFGSTVGETAAGLVQSPQPPAPHTILTSLLNDLSLLASVDSPLQPHYVLVLEDYHVITAQPIHEILTYLIDHAPPHLHVILTTRADPPLPFSRWRARDQLSEIRAADLRFTPDEAAAFLNDRMALHLTPTDVMALEVRTEGWIAGLQLVALSLQGRENKADFVQTFSGSHRYVLNYLVEEVLNQQTKIVQEFLLRTAILDRLCGSLCDAVIGDWGGARATPAAAPLAQAILDEIEQANLFLTPLDDEGHWYRYHPLFAEVLQHRLRQTQPALVAQLHDRASRWYEQQGLLSDAIHHALRSADFSHTAELIEQSWSPIWNQGAVATLLHWVRALPVATLVARPNLAISHAWALALIGQIEAAEAALGQIETELHAAKLAADALSPPQDMLLGRIAGLRAMLVARRGDPVQAVALAQQALQLIPAATPLLRGNANYALGLAYQQSGLLNEALRAYQAATRLGVTADDHFLTITARYHEGRAWMALGQLRMAAVTYQQMLNAATQGDRPAPVIGLVHVGYAEILYQWNDLPAAAQQIESGLALSPSGSLTYTDGPLHRFLILARIRQALGDPAGVLAAVQQATETAHQTGIALDAARAAALTALVQLRLGQIDAASQWAQFYAQALTTEECFMAVHEFETLVFGRILLAQGRVAELQALLAHWLPIVEAAQRIGCLIELCILQAQALHLDGQSDEAKVALVRALTLAEPEGYLRLFVDEGEPIQLLILECRSFQDKPWLVSQAQTEEQAKLLFYIDKLLQAMDLPPPLSDQGSTTEHHKTQSLSWKDPKSKIQNLIEPLTSRELEILHLIAAGLSNAAIAEQLVVSVGTVKTHLKHIYGKLAVESRTQAVAQARAVGLLA